MITDRGDAPSVPAVVNVIALGFHDAQGENCGWLKETSREMDIYENEFPGLARRDVLMHHLQSVSEVLHDGFWRNTRELQKEYSF